MAERNTVKRRKCRSCLASYNFTAQQLKDHFARCTEARRDAETESRDNLEAAEDIFNSSSQGSKVEITE